MKEKCYFAYCWDDPSKVMDLMEYLKNRIKTKSNCSIQVIIDKKDFHTSENFKENEKKIFKSDSVVIFFSPAYKTIIDEADETRGVYREYMHILKAWQANEIAVIPIIVEGEVNKVITREFKDNIATDFSRFLPIIKGQIGRKKLNPVYKTEMNNLVSDIIYETSVAHRRKDYRFSSKEEAYSILFCNTDSKDKLPRGCMYKSEAYKNIMAEEGTSFLVGRKGSGKTTFFEVLEKYNPMEFDKRFKVLRPISVEDIREDHIYSVLDKLSLDHKIFGLGRIIELFWEIYLHLCAIYIVCVEEENHRIRDERKEIFHKIANKLKKALHVQVLDSNDVKRAIFTESVVLWENFMNAEVLDFATEKAFLASMDANFNVNNVIKTFLGKNLYNHFLNAIDQCDKKILLALDKFDTISDDFRRNVKDDLQTDNESLKIDARKRAEFDRLLYRSLVTTVENLKTSDTGIMGNTTFCIIIPQDRVDQVRMVDRDFAKKNFMSLSWDAIELLEVIVLRLKELYGFSLDSNNDIIETFKQVMHTYMPAIPNEIKIEIGDTEKTIDLFQYLLRISFWRPRDIIKYIAVLYDANEKNSKKYKTIDMDTLKNLLNNVTEDIIKNEFYNEYNKIFYNIDNFMEIFEESNVILSTSEFIDKIRGFKFEGIIFDEESQLIEKIKMLYEFGVIGLKFDQTYIKSKSIGNTLCFVFNEGMYPFDKARNEIVRGTKMAKFVLNPIFSKKLSLHYNTTEVIGAYGWDYLQNNHARKMGINRI